MSAPGFNLENKLCSGLMKYAGFDHRRRRGPRREPDTAETFNQLNNSTADPHGIRKKLSRIFTELKGP